MDSLLRHMVDMTGHRDHTMLDISVISAVQELSGAARTRVLTISSVGEQYFVRSRACIRAGISSENSSSSRSGIAYTARRTSARAKSSPLNSKGSPRSRASA